MKQKFVDFFSERQQDTIDNRIVSSTVPITAIVIQGSEVGPAVFVVCASDLSAVAPGNRTTKYAEYVILVISASKSSKCITELDLVKVWTAANILVLNERKSKEMICFT